MRNIILYAAISIDSYIARSNGDVNWLQDPDFITPGNDYGYAAFYESIGTTLMGNQTYKMIQSFDVPFPYPDKENFVFTRSSQKSEDEHVSFISGDIISFIKELKNKNGKDIWLVGGGSINSFLLNHGLIDKMILTVFPVVLGTGIRLFEENPGEARFSLLEAHPLDKNIAQLIFCLR